MPDQYAPLGYYWNSQTNQIQNRSFRQGDRQAIDFMRLTAGRTDDSFCGTGIALYDSDRQNIAGQIR